MAELQGQVGEVRMTIEIKRKATGKVEKFDLIGKVGGYGNDAFYCRP